MPKKPNPQLTKVAPLPAKGRTMPRKPTTPKDQTTDDVIDKTIKGMTDSPKPGTSLVSYKERMAALVAQTKKAEQPSGGFISLKGGHMSIGGVQLPGDKIIAIIPEYRKDNEFYPRAYEPGVSQFPACHAIVRPHEVLSPWRKLRDGEDVEMMEHFDKATGLVSECSEPQVKPGQGCDSCKRLEWGSAKDIIGKVGKKGGKACRESRRINIFAADQCTNPADVDRAPYYTMIPPPTSLPNFQRFANEVSEVLDTAIFGVIAEISVKPDDDYQFMAHYKILDKIKDEGVLMALLGRHEQLSLKNIVMPKKDSTDAEKDARGTKF